MAPRTPQFVVALLTAALATTLMACSSGNNTAEPTDAHTSSPAFGGELVFLESQAPTCFYAGGSGFYPVATILNQLGDKLTYQDPETREISPWLAESWVINEDATEYIFTLRNDVTFSDGTPLDAATVALNFDHFGLGNPELGLAAQEFVSNYVASEIIDTHTVKFTFSAPTPGFLQATSVVGAAIVAESTASLPYEAQCQLENLIATGPFTVADFEVEQEYNLAVREDYNWAPATSEHQGRAYLDRINITITPEDNVRTGALNSGQAHAIRGVQVHDIAAVEAAGADVSFAPTNGVNPQFALRSSNPLLSDIQVRKALLHGTDTAAIIDTVYQNKFTPATSPLSTSATGYVDLSDKLTFDPAHSAELLDAAGWVPGEDGIREKDGERLSLTTWTIAVFPQNQELAELVAQQWEAIGVELKIENPDQATITANQHDFTQQPVAITHVGRVDPDVLKSNFHSASHRNALVSEDATLDALLDQVASLPDAEARYAAAAEVQHYLIDQAYTIPLYELPQVYAAAPNTLGLSFEAVGRATFYDTWIQQ